MVEDISRGDTPADAEALAGEPVPEDSLIEEVRDLVEDGRTYLETELQYQKTRAALVFDRGRTGAIYGLIALGLAHLALVALVVGLVIALTPLVSAWGATAIVVGVLAIVAVVFAFKAKRRVATIANALGETGE